MADDDKYEGYEGQGREYTSSIFNEGNIGDPSDFDAPTYSRKFAEAEDEPYFSDMDDYFESQGTDHSEHKVHSSMSRAAKNYAKEQGARRAYGLEGDKMFDYASRLADTAAGKRKTAGQIEAERQLKILSGAQRGFGAAQSRGSFEAADLLRAAGGAAQASETEGESAIADASRQAQLEAGSQLEQLLIQGQQRAEDRAFAMQQLAFQQEQASGSLWSNVLGGILGAVGGTIGFFAGGGPAGAAAGAAIGTSGGKAFGSYVG